MSSKGSRSAIHVVRKKRSKGPSSAPYFHVGETIPSSGIYRVSHSIHRVSHDVTLLQGEVFPPCIKCGDKVHFDLVKAVQEIKNDYGFHVRLYQLPHPEEKPAVKRTA